MQDYSNELNRHSISSTHLVNYPLYLALLQYRIGNNLGKYKHHVKSYFQCIAL